MKLRHLRTFLTVGERESVSAAARQLGLTPSTVSAHIKALEDEFGLQLFERRHDGVRLTDTGERLREHARRVLAAAEAFGGEAQACRAQLTGSLRLALSVSDACFDIASFVSRLNQHHPALQLKLARDESARILAALSAGDLDLGIVYGDADATRFRHHRLGQAELVVAAPKPWQEQLRGEGRLLGRFHWIDTGADCPFHRVSRDFFVALGISPPLHLRVDDNQTRQSLVAGGMGVSLLERAEAQHPDIAILDFAPLPCPVSLVYPAQRQFEPLIKAARDLILPARPA